MKEINESKHKKYDRWVKVLQGLSCVFIVAMIVAGVIFIIENKISVNNIDAITSHIHGGTLTVSLIIILFTVVKSFSLIFPPVVMYFAAGVMLGDPFTAVLISLIASALSLILPYYFGRFTGKDMLHTLERRFKAVKKLEDFTDENASVVIFVLKVSGIIPSDLTSVIFGAMNIPFGKYFLFSNLGLLALNVSWSFIGAWGELTDPLTYLYMLPIVICLLGSFIYMKKAKKRKEEKTSVR